MFHAIILILVCDLSQICFEGTRQGQGTNSKGQGSPAPIGGLPHPHFPKKCTQCAQCGPSVGGKHFFDPFSHFMHTFFEYIHTLFRGDTLYEHFFMGVTPLCAHFILMMKHLRHTFGSLGDHFSRFACTCVTLWSHFHLPAPAPAPAPAYWYELGFY